MAVPVYLLKSSTPSSVPASLDPGRLAINYADRKFFHVGPNGTTVEDVLANWVPKQLESFVVAVSDETTALTTGAAKVTFRMPYGVTLVGIKASLSTAQASGSIFTVDVNEGGSSILSTKLTIDNTEKTSVTAATPAVISDATLADDAEITIDIDQIGNGSAKGLKVTFIWRQT